MAFPLNEPVYDDADTFPTTSNTAVGVLVPIPTFPLALTNNLDDTEKSDPDVVGGAFLKCKLPFVSSI